MNKAQMATKCVVHSGLVVNSGSVAFIGLRKIYRFNYFKDGKFSSLRILNFIALKSATKPYISRYSSIKFWIRTIYSWVHPQHVNSYLNEFSFRINRSIFKKSIFHKIMERIVLGEPLGYKDIIAHK